jgi:CheY-like chemotaxis protein
VRVAEPPPVAARRAPAAADGPPRLAAGLAGLRVLLAEDNPVNALVAEALLQQLGCVVETVSDGAAAVARMQALMDGGDPDRGRTPAAQPAAIDLILMDCQMPVLDGYQAAQRIRAAEAALGRPPVPIVALTASTLPDDRQRCLAAGMQAHLGKPFTNEELVAVLGEVATAR